MIVNVEVLRREEAFNLLSQMAQFGLIRLSPPCKSAGDERREKLSERFAGTMRLSDLSYQNFQNAVRESR